MLLFYVRHGDPTYDPDSLTDLGRKQAEALKCRFAQSGVTKIFSSSSNRAMQTAQPTAEMLGIDIVSLDWCQEYYAWLEYSVPEKENPHAWVFYNKDYKKLFVSEEIYKLGERWYEHPAFDGTGMKSGTERIRRETDAFMLSLGYRHDREQKLYIAERPNSERVALFAHQGFGYAFLSALLDIPYPIFCTHTDISHTGVCVIEFPDSEGEVIPKLLQHSNDSHLFFSGIPTKYNNGILF